MPLHLVSRRSFHACIALLCALTLAACGGGGGVSVPDGVTIGGGTGGTGTGGTPAAACSDVAGAAASNVRFSATDKGANVLTSSTGVTACFTSPAWSAVRSTTAIQPGSFHYFEATRSGAVAMGVATAAMTLQPNNTAANDINATDQALFARFVSIETATPGLLPFNLSRTETTFGFAVDYRGRFPVVYVIGSTAAAATEGIVADQCTGTGVTSNATTPCVYGVQVMTGVTSPTPLYIYALGSTEAGGSPKVSINGGTDLTGRAFNYAPLAVRNALRKRWIYSERQFNAQWPQTATQAAAAGLPTITAAAGTGTRAVVLSTDAAPYRASFGVTAADAAGAALTGSSVQWLTETGALIQTGLSLDLTAANTRSTVGIGTQRIQAVVTDPTTRQVAGIDFVLTYTATDSDDDGDGLSYSQEQGVATDPSNSDTDADGLSDGVEVALGVSYNPTQADTIGSGVSDGVRRAGSGALSTAVVRLAREAGASGTATNPGVVLLDDRLTIALTSLLNGDCQFDRGVFAGAGRVGSANGQEECRKRAIRADVNAGIKPGEFRYFETRRLLPNGSGGGAPNMGQGFITASGRIDPFCCVQQNGSTPVAETPPSFMLNSAAGVWDSLVSIGIFDTLNTFYIGFAVDYRSGPPKAYAITTAADGTTPVVIGPRTIAGFTGDAIPFVYGHPQSDTRPAIEINFGLKTFHYPATAVRNLIDTASATAGTGDAMTRGVGVHYQP